jgi:single-strand DNA-binding protein
MNSWSATARLGGDAELKYTPEGTPVCEFSAAVQFGYGENRIVSWPIFSVWNKKGEAVFPYLKKGSHVAVTGELYLHTYQNKSGVERSDIRVRVNDITLLDKRGDKELPPAREPKKADGFQPDPFDDDEPLPF